MPEQPLVPTAHSLSRMGSRASGAAAGTAAALGLGIVGEDVKESDWKVFRSLKDTLLERFCQLTLVSAEEIIEDGTNSAHERYLALFSLIKKNDKALSLAFDGVSRSNAMGRLAFMRSGGLFTDEEFSRFSLETREQIERIVQSVEDE